MTISEVAKTYGYSYNTVHTWVMTGKLPARRVRRRDGSTWFVSKKDAEKVVAKQRLREMTPARLKVLWLLDTMTLEGHGEPPTQQELGRRYGYKHPRTMKYHVESLERLGFIERREGGGLGFTEKGMRLLQKVYERMGVA